MLLAGLDIGTTGCKVTAYSADGEYLGRIYQDYPVQRSFSAHEVDAEAIWQAVKLVLRKAAEKYPGIGGIGITSFGETFVLLDESDKPLAPAMLYTDPRGDEECAQLVDRLGKEKIIGITGLNPHSMYSIPKLMWIKRHNPELYARATRICLLEDYIVYLLTGNAQIDYSLASRTMAFDIRTLHWSEDVFRAADVNISLFSKPVPIGTAVGMVKPDVSSVLGITGSVLVVCAGHDQVTAAIGSGVFDESCAVDGAGTVECITPVFEQVDPAMMANGNYSVVPYIMPGKYVCYAFSYTGGALVKWFVDNLAGYAADNAEKKGHSIYAELEDSWNNAPTGLLVLPHFSGAATPYMDAGSRGAILGLTLVNTQRDIHLAIMEGVCYEMRLNMERLSEAGIEIKALRATGGGANSRVWMQMKADILNVPVTSLGSAEAGAAGSAMMVGVAANVFQNLNEAARVLVTQRGTYQPRLEVHEAYFNVYERYKKLYAAVRPLV